MKIKTLEQIKIYMDSNKIYFPDELPFAKIYLTKGEICGIIQLEYGIYPKKARIIKKNLSKLMNDMLRYVLEVAKRSVNERRKSSSD